MRLLALRLVWLPVSVLAATLVAAAMPRGSADESGEPSKAGSTPSIHERAVSELVLIETYATDGRGLPVTGLKADDFVLIVDGHKSPIASFESHEFGPDPLDTDTVQGEAARTGGPEGGPVEPPRRFMLFFEDGFSAPGGLTAARHAARQFLTSGLLPTDQIGIAAYDRGLRILHDFTSDRNVLREVIDHSLHEARRASEFVVEQQSHDDEIAGLLAQFLQMNSINVAGSSFQRREAVRRAMGDLASGKEYPPAQQALLEKAKRLALNYGSEELQRLGGLLAGLRVLVDSMAGWNGYKTIVYMGDGLPENPALPYVEQILGVAHDPALMTRIRPMSLATELQDLLQAAAAAGVTIHTLQTRGLEAGNARNLLAARRRSNSLEAIALGTGGMASSSNDFLKALNGFEAGSRSYYVLGYQPQGDPDGRYHPVQVQCRKRGVLLRWRKGFTRLKPEEARQRTILAAYTVPEVYAQMGIGLSAIAGPGVPSGRIMDLVVHVPGEKILYRSEEGRSTAHLEVGLVAVDEGTRKTVEISRQVDVALPAEPDSTAGVGIDLVHRIRLPAGGQSITAVVYDAIGGATGGARLVVPPASQEPVRVVGLSIYSLREKSLWIDLPEANAAKSVRGVGNASTVGPALKSVYAPDEPLVCGFRMGGEAGIDGIDLEVAIRRGDQTLRTVAVEGRDTGADGKMHVPLPIAGLGPGVYTVTVQEILPAGLVDRGATTLVLSPIERPTPSTAESHPL